MNATIRIKRDGAAEIFHGTVVEETTTHYRVILPKYPAQTSYGEWFPKQSRCVSVTLGHTLPAKSEQDINASVLSLAVKLLSLPIVVM